MSRPAANLRDLDALRGFLAVVVLLGHSRWLLWAGHAAWVSHPQAAWEVPLAYASAPLRYGREAVMVFFVLSGFFIHLRWAQSLRRREPVSFSPAGFYRRRAHRLLAPYALALVVTVVCDLIGRTWFPQLYGSATGDALLDANFAKASYAWASVLPALLVLPSSLGLDFGTNGPLWSLAYETVYYALYPAWFALRRRHPALAFGVVPACCLALALVPVPAFPAAVLTMYPIWLSGAWLAEHVDGLGRSPRLLLGSLAAIAAGIAVFAASPSMAPRTIAAILFGGGAVAGVLALPESWRPARVLGAWEFLGIRAYTIYIVHFPVLALLSAWTFDRFGARPLHGWLAVAGACLALAFACLCFHFCERHFLHPRLRVITADRVSTSGAAARTPVNA